MFSTFSLHLLPFSSSCTPLPNLTLQIPLSFQHVHLTFHERFLRRYQKATYFASSRENTFDQRSATTCRYHVSSSIPPPTCRQRLASCDRPLSCGYFFGVRSTTIDILSSLLFDCFTSSKPYPCLCR
ncbi:hypothetical protein DFJ73DRAFT_866480 [Zopfochytrium polystomum]|nr:hypothetical protein DFJ73DRAFT_866480 [Zopfochytrium polystomum]